MKNMEYIPKNIKGPSEEVPKDVFIELIEYRNSDDELNAVK